jgi:hypothetical protein
MDLRLKHFSITDKGAFGHFLDSQGNIIIYTLEHTYQDSPTGPWLPKIPPGTYTCRRRFSPHFQMELFLIENVPGHDMCEIHPGNVEANSDGCVLTGSGVFNDALTLSRVAFAKYMALQDGLDTWLLTVS